jgi:antitoxin component of RelBE/YafQ-DinJ toxin-antitoxin module
MPKQMTAIELIEHITPPHIRSLMGQSIRHGYANVEVALKQFEFLNWKIGKQLRSYAQLVAIQWILRQMAEKKVLPFEPKIKSNSQNNYSYLELHTEGALITIARSEDPDLPGRHSKSRDVYSANNTLQLFDLLEERPGFLLLCFGASNPEPSFGRIGVPSLGCDKWVDHKDVLTVSEPKAGDVSDIIDPRETLENILEVINNAQKESACAGDSGKTS